MLLFLVPLRARANSPNWSLVSRLCLHTLCSLSSQTSADCAVLLICHDPPGGDLPPNVEILRADFPPPSAGRFAERDYDKWEKLRMGLVRARQIDPEFFMFVDADDCVDVRIASKLKQKQPEHGFVIRRGFSYRLRANWLTTFDNFDRGCGSSAAIRVRSVTLPRTRDHSEIQQCLPLIAGHTIIRDRMTEAGIPLKVYPHRGAVKIIHGENHSRLAHGKTNEGRPSLRMRLGAVRRQRYLSERVCKKFGMEREALKRGFG